MGQLTGDAQVQLITATHSPLVLASTEPFFDPQRDAWFDIDLVQESDQAAHQVKVTHRSFSRKGGANEWLTSEAFDLPSSRSVEAEQVLERAAKALSDHGMSIEDAQAVDKELREVLSDTDPFWLRWRYVAQKRGWLK